MLKPSHLLFQNRFKKKLIRSVELLSEYEMSFSDEDVTYEKPKKLSRMRRNGVIKKRNSLGAKRKKKNKRVQSEEETVNRKRKIILVKDSEEEDSEVEDSEEDDSDEDDSEEEEEEAEEEEENEEEKDVYNDPRANGHVEIDSCVDGHQQFHDNWKAKVVKLEQECKAANINAGVLKHIKIVKPKVCLVFI